MNLNNSKTNSASLLALANVEALADDENQTMTDEEYTDATDCVAIGEPHYCTGKDGVKYSYSDPV